MSQTQTDPDTVERAAELDTADPNYAAFLAGHGSVEQVRRVKPANPFRPDAADYLARVVTAAVGHGPWQTVLDGEIVRTIQRLEQLGELEITLESGRVLDVQITVRSR